MKPLAARTMIRYWLVSGGINTLGLAFAGYRHRWWLLALHAVLLAVAAHQIAEWVSAARRVRTMAAAMAVQAPPQVMFGAPPPLASSRSMQAYFASSRTSADRTSPTAVPAEVPILAKRFAMWSPAGVAGYFPGARFRSLVIGYGSVDSGFGLEATAECVMPIDETIEQRHVAPEWYCSCGFYSWGLHVPVADRRWTLDLPYVALLVELSGKVIEHERGFRAQHQRVVEIQVLPGDPLHANQRLREDMSAALGVGITRYSP